MEVVKAKGGALHNLTELWWQFLAVGAKEDTSCHTIGNMHPNRGAWSAKWVVPQVGNGHTIWVPMRLKEVAILTPGAKDKCFGFSPNLLVADI